MSQSEVVVVAIGIVSLTWSWCAWVRARDRSKDAMLIRWVIGPAIGNIGATQIPLLHTNTTMMICLTVIAVAALWVLDRTRSA